MKKLLLLFLMTLLSITAVDAALVYLRFSSTQGGYDVSGTLIGQLPQGSNSTTWVYTCKGSALSSYVSNNGFYIRPRVDYHGVDDYYNTVDEAAVNITNGGAAHTFYRWNDNRINGKFGHVSGLPADYADYDFTFTVSYTDGSGQASLTVSWEKPSNIQLKSTIDSWHGTNYDSYENGVYTWTWNKTQLSGVSAGTLIKFKLYDPDTDTWYGPSSNDTELDNNTWSSTSVSSDAKNWYTTHQKGYTYTIEAKKSGSQWQIRYIRNEEDHDYYWVSPEITNNQKWEYFKMVPSRNRSGSFGDGKISDKYFSFTIKDSDLKKWDGTALNEGDDIKWYVVRDDEKKWFRPVNDIDNGDNIGEKPRPAGNSGVRADFYSYNYEDCGTTTSRTGHFIFEKGTNVSYTFILNAKPSSGSGNLFVDSPDPETIAANHLPGVDDNGYEYYLIGNFNSASEAEYISVTNTNHPMTKLWYVGSTKSYSDPGEPCDSIVYECSVSKPNGGWGNLYLDINPARVTDWSNENELGPQYRPLISLGNVLDGRALVGGLTRYNSHQSLNPEPSEFYTGYTFRFNATTMTYHLEFHTSLYLVGDGVTAKDDNNNTLGGKWDLTAPDALIPLKATQDSRHFRNTVTFVNGAVSGTDNTGKGFRFLLTEDESENRTYARNWGENTNAPRWLSLDESADHFAGPDTQYKNYLLYTENGADSSTSPSGQGSNVIFDLADGEYVINFYNYASPYYTIERKGEMRDYNEVIYKNQRRYILGRGETGTGNHDQRDFTNAYKHFCVWSDYIAWNKPDDVDVYALTAFTPSGSHTATVTLTKQDISYIPAKKAVILAMKTDKNSLNGGMVYDAVKPADLLNNTGFNRVIMDMTPYATPDATLDEGVGVEQFKPLYESTELSRYEGTGDSQKANYLFGFYHANHVVAGNTYDNADFLLGFWQTTGNGSTYPNSGFLQLTRAQADELGVGAAYTITDGGAGAPAFLLLFDDEDATVTGIRDLDAEVPSVKDSADDHWYTLSGVRIAQPTAKGIYIHGGKKVIVR